jgi:hypothetical protein
MDRRNPHEGRLSEVYSRGPDGLRWIGYTAEPPFDNKNAHWDTSLQGWIIDEEAKTSTTAAQQCGEGAGATRVSPTGGTEQADIYT